MNENRWGCFWFLLGLGLIAASFWLKIWLWAHFYKPLGIPWWAMR